MDVLSQGNNPSPFISSTFENDRSKVGAKTEIFINDNKSDENVFQLNPMLNDSLNNLVKRMERSQIQKLSPNKSQCIYRKSKLSNSLPNIFLPSVFDDNKCSNGEKKVQWTNKMNFNLERLKNAFRDSFNYWCQQKRSQSIPNLKRSSNDNLFMYSSDFFMNDVDMNIEPTNVDRKHVHSSNTTTHQSPLKLDSSQNSTIVASHIPEKINNGPYLPHVFLDDAIIEPISPAILDQSANIIDNYSMTMSKDKEIRENVVPAPRKRGRPKKTQQPPDLKEIPHKTVAEQFNRDMNKDESTKKGKSKGPVLQFQGKRETPGTLLKQKETTMEKAMDSKMSKIISKVTKLPSEDTSKRCVELILAKKQKKLIKEERLFLMNKESEIAKTKDDNHIEKCVNPNYSKIQRNPTNVIDTSPEKVIKHKLTTKTKHKIVENKVATSTYTKESVTVGEFSSIPVSIDNESLNSTGQSHQSDDIKVLSRSIIDVVDTSMLPPRKRYKQLMYLENTSQQTSPKPVSVVDTSPNTDNCDILSKTDEDREMYQTDIKKAKHNRSQLKGKKQTKRLIDIDIVAVKAHSVKFDSVKDDIKSEEEKLVLISHNEEAIEKPCVLKRSKREAAARGFANMVAMSLNSSSLTHETTSDLIKKTASNKFDSVTESVNKKIFKKPRKSITANVGVPKTQETSSNPFEFRDEVEADLLKISSKKLKLSNEKQSENPPSPGDTIISNCSSSHETMKYRKIRTNTYVDAKPSHWSQEVEKCGCKSSSLKHLYEKPENIKKTVSGTLTNVKRTSNIVWDCTDNCLNRLTYTECNSKTCPCGDLCNNQKIRKLDWATGLKVSEIQSKGRGVITTKRIAEGILITEYVGEVISEETFQDRMINLYKEDAHHYCLHLDGEMLIDAYRSGSVARFVNHSCQPNCEMQKWMVNGAYRMCLFAIETIQPNTELTYDYNFCSFNTKMAQTCLCGAPNCRGLIGGRPRAEQSESQKDRKRLFYAFGRTLSGREKLFVLRRAIFLVRGRTLGRCKRLGIRRSKQTHGNKLPSTITEIKRRKAKKNQFLTQMSALNSIRSIRTRLLQNAQDNENLTRTAQLAQVLRDLYNTLLEQKDPANAGQQLVAPFINCLKQKKYPEFFRMIEPNAVVSLSEVYSRLLDGKYSTMMAFDQDILQMIQTIELYAGKQSNIGQCAERIKSIYKELKMNAIALYEALTDELIDEKDKHKLLSNNLTQITNAVKSQTNGVDSGEQSDLSSPSKSKRRKQNSSSTVSSARSRLDRGAEVIKCVCGFLIEAGHVMVQCDRCFVWQHSYCMNVARSAELTDVTRLEPYHCHICLNIPTESLIREIPRHFVISDEIVESGNTLFWTLLHRDTSLLKIDDFVYIRSSNDGGNEGEDMKQDLSKRTIMRIYSLWKDSNGQRWMEGGLFLRPYNNYLKNILETSPTSLDSSNKRKSSSTFDLSSHKWHRQDVVYTDLTRILPLDDCLGRCHVLNNHTFRLGHPLMHNGSANDDIYVCDWFVNSSGQWSDIDSTYLKINTKPYCFERFADDTNTDNNLIYNEKFLRHYTADNLLKFDQGSMDSGNGKIVKGKSGLSQEEKRILRKQNFAKLITKLSEFAYERNRKLPMSGPSSLGSLSTPSSRGTSPLCENAGSKSPIIEHGDYFHHSSRKQLFPQKTVASLKITKEKKPPITTKSSENSPTIMIVLDENLSPIQEELSSVDDKSLSTKESPDEMSSPCSEIKYGDFLELIKETAPKVNIRKVAEKETKSNVITCADSNRLPIRKRCGITPVIRQTRSRKSQMTDDDDDNSEHKYNSEEEESKKCFIKLERIKVHNTEDKVPDLRIDVTQSMENDVTSCSKRKKGIPHKMPFNTVDSHDIVTAPPHHHNHHHNHHIESSESSVSTTLSTTTTDARHNSAANDFSSIENISAN